MYLICHKHRIVLCGVQTRSDRGGGAEGQLPPNLFFVPLKIMLATSLLGRYKVAKVAIMQFISVRQHYMQSALYAIALPSVRPSVTRVDQ